MGFTSSMFTALKKAFTNIFSSYYSLVNLALDVNEMTEKLPEEYKTPVEETVQKQLEYQFHSADYHTMLQMITGLKTALGHLIKVSAILNFVIYSWAIP